jgi:hypothetical protein
MVRKVRTHFVKLNLTFFNKYAVSVNYRFYIYFLLEIFILHVENLQNEQIIKILHHFCLSQMLLMQTSVYSICQPSFIHKSTYTVWALIKQMFQL